MSIVLITGPIASGKSTIGRALAERCREMGQVTDLIDLDDVVLSMHGSIDWETEDDRLADWLEARRAAAGQANAAVAEGKRVVIAGPFYLEDEIAGFTRHLAGGVPLFLYVLESPLAIRLERNRARARVPDDAEIVEQDAAIRDLPEVLGAVLPNSGNPRATVDDLLWTMSQGIGRLQ